MDVKNNIRFIGSIFITFLIFISLIFLAGVYRIRHIDYEKIYQDLEDYLKNESVETTVAVHKDGHLHIIYEDKTRWFGKVNLKDLGVEVPLSRDLIYLFGASEIFAKPVTNDKLILFSERLSKLLNASSANAPRVYNLGIYASDSVVIKSLIEKTVAYRKPKMIIYYDPGYIDLNKAYAECVKKIFIL